MGGFLAPKPPKQPVAPTNNDAAVQAAADEARRRAQTGGQAATVLTSGVGDIAEPNKVKNTLGV